MTLFVFWRMMRLRIRRVLPWLLLLLSFAALPLSAACGGNGSAAGGRVKAVTTLPLFADLVRAVGGDRVDVSALLPAGSDPHTFEPAPRDVQRASEARIAFANGLGLEPAALRIIEANLPSGSLLVRLADKAVAAGARAVNDDPHLWMDAENGKLYAAAIRDGLSEVDPAGASEYERNYAAYVSQLDEAAAYARGQVATIPESNRKLVTTHDAFGYLARWLGLEVIASVARGPGQEPSPGDVAHLASAIEDQHVPAVFREPQIGSERRLLEQAAGDAGVRVCTLYSDSLDNTVQTYLDLLRYDADQLAACLGGGDGG